MIKNGNSSASLHRDPTEIFAQESLHRKDQKKLTDLMEVLQASWVGVFPRGGDLNGSPSVGRVSNTLDRISPESGFRGVASRQNHVTQRYHDEKYIARFADRARPLNSQRLIDEQFRVVHDTVIHK
jgi:hypothetical protein